MGRFLKYRVKSRAERAIRWVHLVGLIAFALMCYEATHPLIIQSRPREAYFLWDHNA